MGSLCANDFQGVALVSKTSLWLQCEKKSRGLGERVCGPGKQWPWPWGREPEKTFRKEDRQDQPVG